MLKGIILSFAITITSTGDAGIRDCFRRCASYLVSKVETTRLNRAVPYLAIPIIATSSYLYGITEGSPQPPPPKEGKYAIAVRIAPLTYELKNNHAPLSAVQFATVTGVSMPVREDFVDLEDENLPEPSGNPDTQYGLLLGKLVEDTSLSVVLTKSGDGKILYVVPNRELETID